MTRRSQSPESVRSPALKAAYPVLRGIFRARGWATLGEKPAVLVYQMAKVGSMTVVRSLRASQPRRPVFHVHTLTPDGIAAMDAFYAWSRVPALPVGSHLLVSRYLEQQIQRGITPGRWKVVTLVRDPVARNISLIFQLGRRLLPDFEERCDAGRLDPVSLLEEFHGAFPAQVDCMRWFREELGRVFRVDVFARPFDRTAGYEVFRGPIADVLLIKTEDLDRCADEALRSFLGLEAFRLKQTNIGTRKSNGHRYRQFLDGLRLPKAFVDRYYETPEVRHFYADAELNAFRARWCGMRGSTS